MINTMSVYGDPTQLACTAAFVRFKEAKLQDCQHRVSDVIGADLILVDYTLRDSMVTLTYVNAANIILQRIAYAREAVLEVTMQESVCRIAPTVKPPSPLKVV